jgi:hypothetical protein
MHLYKLEIELETQMTYLLVVAESDEKAFGYIDEHLAQHFVKRPTVKEASIIQKKSLRAGQGYIIETQT